MHYYLSIIIYLVTILDVSSRPISRASRTAVPAMATLGPRAGTGKTSHFIWRDAENVLDWTSSPSGPVFSPGQLRYGIFIY